MRKILFILAASAAFATPAAAQYAQGPYAPYHAPAAGALVGTAVGLGAYNDWWGGRAFGANLPSSAAGAATTGLVAGVGTVALIDAATAPCRGFRALFSPFSGGPSGCVNGEWVGYGRAPRMR